MMGANGEHRRLSKMNQSTTMLNLEAAATAAAARRELPVPAASAPTLQAIDDLAEDIENLSGIVQQLGERFADHESTVEAKLDHLLKIQLEAKMNDTWGQ